MTLYEINEAIMGCVDTETGEIVDFDQLDALQMARDEKLENIALYIKSLEAEALAISNEVYLLQKRKDSKTNKAKRLREYLSFNLDGQPFETPRVALTFRKSTGVKITDERELVEWLQQHHDECLSYKAPTVLKTGVAHLIKIGEAVPGAMIEQKNNMQLN
jgi:hypothetical protein